MKLRHTAVWVGCTAAALIATTACGAETAKRTAEVLSNTDKIMAVLSKAGDRTEKAGSAEVEVVTTTAGSGSVTMKGTYTWGDGYAFDARTDTKAAGMSALQHDPTMRALFVDGNYYYEIDPQPSGPVAGKGWLKIDGSAVLGSEAADALQKGGAGGSPAEFVKGLRYASDVKDLGRKSVDGKATSHYRAVIQKNDLGRFKGAYGGGKSLLGSMTGEVDEITMDVWVGRDDLPVRMTEKFGNTAVGLDFLKFGATKEIQAPPASETGDITKLMQQEVAKSGAGAGSRT